MKKISNTFIAYIAFALILLALPATNVWAQKEKTAAKTPPKAASTNIKPKTIKANAPVEQLPQEEPAAPAVVALPAKPPRTKICVAAPKTNLAPAETAPESLRNSLFKYLSGPAAEIVPLEALVAMQQQAEAAEKGCGFYLAVSVTQKKSGGGEGLSGIIKKGSNAVPLLDNLGLGKTAQTVSRVARASQTKLTTAADLAAGIKAKDEVTLEYNLFDAQTRAIATKGKIKAKANKDGEDILSSLLEQSINDVLTAALKK